MKRILRSDKMRTEQEIRKQIEDCRNAIGSDASFSYGKPYINALSWVLEEE
jgi:hypothetical protein